MQCSRVLYRPSMFDDQDGDGEIDMGEFVGKGKGLQRRCIESKV